jgi:hypothetical protein
MIDKKKIEEAANKICDYGSIYDSEYRIDGFKKGANWAINEFLKSLWHPASEEPKDKSAILLRYTGSMFKWTSLDEVDADDWKQTVKELSITRWLYIDDLLKGGNNG